MSDLIIFCSSNSKQTGVTIQDKTDWDLVGGSPSSLTNIIVNLYGTSLTSPVSSYRLSSAEELLFVETGEVDVVFKNLNGITYLDDGWWTINITTNSGANSSNYAGFGVWANIKYAVFSEINSLHSPEDIKYNAERYCLLSTWLQGLQYLDTTNINSRGIKFMKRLVSLQKMLLKI